MSVIKINWGDSDAYAYRIIVQSSVFNIEFSNLFVPQAGCTVAKKVSLMGNI